MIVAHNLMAMNANRMFGKVNNSQRKSTEKLSSGYKINRAADDAAGLTISEKMRSLVRGLNQGSYNIQDGISLIQIADGALSEVNSMLHRMTELAVKAANGTNTDADRMAVQSEISQIKKEVDRIAKSTEFNTMPLFDDVSKSYPDGKLTALVSCDGIPEGKNNGYITQTYQDPFGKWHAAGILDFDNVTPENIDKLDGESFSFTCSASCNEAFKIEFNIGKGNKCSNLNGEVTHTYNIDIEGCTSGKEILDRALKYIKENPSSKTGLNTTTIPNALAVSHSNGLIRKGNTIVIFSLMNQPTKKDALDQGQGYKGGTMGGIRCSDMNAIMVHPAVTKFPIQCSNIVDDVELIKTRRMNSKLIGISDIDVSTQDGAKEALEKVEKASAIISEQRSELGAYQNRLEHSYANNENKAENTQAAESRIRDTDMAKEMVAFSLNNILAQAGTSMLSQANQSAQSVLSLLQ